MKFRTGSYLTFVLLALLSINFSLTSCDNDKLEPIPEPEFCDTIVVSYQLNIKPIVDTYCAYSGCHDGSAPGVYSSYEGMLGNLESGKITERSIQTRDMPPSYSTPGFETLPEEEYNMLTCWIEKGYPEL